MPDWLTDNFWLFGLSGQNWMLVAGGGLLLYSGALALVHHRQTRAQNKARHLRHPSAS